MEKVIEDVRSRGWLITLPYKKDESVYKIKYVMTILSKYKTYAFQVEKGGNTGYLHYQIYVEHSQAIRFSTLKAAFPHAHLETRIGSKKQAWDYCTKEDTRLHGPWTSGIKPEEEDKLKKREQYLIDIGNGMSDRELLLKYPGIFKLQEVVQFRSILGVDLYAFNREVTVNYLWGLSRTGKSSYVHSLYDNKDIYVVSDYERDPFGSYDGQKVIVFEEFRSDIPLKNMLQYLDRYPCKLPSRYVNKQALFTEVWIISNWNLDFQYMQTSVDDKQAFINRVKNVYLVTEKTIQLDQYDEHHKKLSHKWIWNPLYTKEEDFKKESYSDEHFSFGF